MIRTIVYALSLVAILCSGPASAAGSGWTVSRVGGPVSIKMGRNVRQASPGLTLPSGAIITTGAGARALLIRGDEYIVVSPRSQLRIPEQRSPNRLIQIMQVFGSAWFKIERKTTPHFGVQTPYLAAVVKGTTFRINVDRSGASVRVNEGAVNVSTRDGGITKMVKAGMKAAVVASLPRQLRVKPAPPESGDAAGEAEFISQAKAQSDAIAQERIQPTQTAFSPMVGAFSAIPGLRIFLGLVVLFGGILVSVYLIRKAFRFDGLALANGGNALRSKPSSTPTRLDRIKVRREETVARTTSRPQNAAELGETPAPNVQQPEAPDMAEADEKDCRRQSKRSRVLLNATIDAGAGSLGARLYDISSTGAVAEGMVVPPVGSRVIVATATANMPAEVIWARGTRFGLRFETAIDDSSLLIGAKSPRRPKRIARATDA